MNFGNRKEFEEFMKQHGKKADCFIHSFINNEEVTHIFYKDRLWTLDGHLTKEKATEQAEKGEGVRKGRKSDFEINTDVAEIIRLMQQQVHSFSYGQNDSSPFQEDIGKILGRLLALQERLLKQHEHDEFLPFVLYYYEAFRKDLETWKEEQLEEMRKDTVVTLSKYKERKEQF